MQGKNRVKPVRRKIRHPAERVDSQEMLALVVSDTPFLLSTIPKSICSDLSTVCFVDDVQPAQVADVLACE